MGFQLFQIPKIDFGCQRITINVCVKYIYIYILGELDLFDKCNTFFFSFIIFN